MDFFNFGVIYLIVVGIIISGLFGTVIIELGEFSVLTMILLMISIMLISPGVYMVYEGYKIRKKNHLIKNRGIKCYAQVFRANLIDKMANVLPIYEVDFIIYLPATDEIKTVKKEVKGYKENIQLGRFIDTLYYEEDIYLEDWLHYTKMCPPTAQEAINNYGKNFDINQIHERIQEAIEEDTKHLV